MVFVVSFLSNENIHKKKKNCILEQIEKRRAEVNEEMAEIVNRFEAATETLQPTSDSHNDTIQNSSLLDQNAAVDHRNDDSFYENNFKSTVSKRNDDSSKHENDDDESSNDDVDDEERSKSKNRKPNKLQLNAFLT